VKSKVIAYLLWILGCFGMLGFHRFYLKKVGTGILWMFTGGLFFIGSIYDLLTLWIQVRECNSPSENVPYEMGQIKAIAIVLSVLMVISCLYYANTVSDNNTEDSINATKETDSTTTKDNRTAADLELLEYKAKSSHYSWSVVGKIKNNTSHRYSYVQIQINLYDDEGNQVGSTMDNLNNLEPGGIWLFDAHVFEERATRFKIEDISGF
jgi:hypothetical protein